VSCVIVLNFGIKNILLFIPIRLDQKRIDPLEVILINKAIINDGAIIITVIINAERKSKRRFIN
jgi:hypothetical protein